jgi:hypothetical protein
MKTKRYALIANALRAIKTHPEQEWVKKAFKPLVSGSGFDKGIFLLREESTSERLVFSCDFHHINDAGYYDGWTEHKCVVTPSLVSGFDARITGRNKNSIKEYISYTIVQILEEEIES